MAGGGEATYSSPMRFLRRFLRRFKWWLVIFAAAGLWGGGQLTYTAARNRSPTEMTCAEFTKSRPDAEWLKLNECELDVAEVAYKGIGDRPRTVYLPLMAPGGPADGSIAIVVETEEERWLDFVEDVTRIGQNPDSTEADFAALVDKYPFVNEPVEASGVAKFGIELKDEEKEELQKLVERLGDDFVLIEQGAAPHLGRSLAMLGLGLLCLTGAVSGFVSKAG